MAEAIRHDAVTEVRVLEPETVTLKLSREEADTLAYLTQWLIGGDATATARRHTEAMAKVLREAGVRPACGDRRFKVKQNWPAVHFRTVDPFEFED